MPSRSHLPALIFQSLRIPLRCWQAHELHDDARSDTAEKRRNSPLITAKRCATGGRRPAFELHAPRDWNVSSRLTAKEVSTLSIHTRGRAGDSGRPHLIAKARPDCQIPPLRRARGLPTVKSKILSPGRLKEESCFPPSGWGHLRRFPMLVSFPLRRRWFFVLLRSFSPVILPLGQEATVVIDRQEVLLVAVQSIQPVDDRRRLQLSHLV